MPHQLMQSLTAECVQGRVKVGKASLTLVGPLSIFKIIVEDQPPRGHHLPSIGEEVRPQYVQQECPSHPSTILGRHLWKRLVIYLDVNGLYSSCTSTPTTLCPAGHSTRPLD